MAMNELSKSSAIAPIEPKLRAKDLSNGRMQRIVDGIFANIFSQAINILRHTVLVPIFLAYWGNQLYGEWLMLSAVAANISMLDLGMHLYIMNRLNQHYTNGEIEEYTNVLHSALFLNLVISSLALIILGIILIVMPLEQWLQFKLTNHATTASVALLLALQIIADIPINTFTGIYNTIGEYPRGVMIRNMQRLVFIALTILMVLAGGSLTAVASMQLVPLFCCGIYVWWDLHRRHPQIRLGLEKRDLKLAFSFIVPSFLFFLIQIAQGLTSQGSILLVGALFGAQSVAVYSILRTLTNIIHQVTGAVSNSLWPELTSLEAQRHYQTLREAQILMSKISLIACICAAIFLRFMGREIVALWVHGRIVYNAQLIDAFLLLLAFQTLWRSSSTILAASNNHRLLSICYIVSGSIGLGIGYLLCRLLGLPGIVFGLLTADLIICVSLIPAAACRMIGQSIYTFFRETLLRGIVNFTLLYLSMHWVFKILPSGSIITRLIIYSMAVGVIGSALGYILWYNQPERDRVRLAIFKILHRFSLIYS